RLFEDALIRKVLPTLRRPYTFLRTYGFFKHLFLDTPAYNCGYVHIETFYYSYKNEFIRG
ncbi:MAG: hypothetical protein AAF798_19850, partial [Bacteroidota bacterium]